MLKLIFIISGVTVSGIRKLRPIGITKSNDKIRSSYIWIWRGNNAINIKFNKKF